MRYTTIRNGAVLLGAGLAGLLDGVLHQIARWHQALSAHVAPQTVEAIERNMLADGLFLAATWLIIFVAILMLWNGVRGHGRLPSLRAVLGSMLVGGGSFNLAEGTLVHRLLGLHHVRDLPAHAVSYDWTFIALSGALVLLGLALRDGKDRVAAPLRERRSGDDRRLAC